MYCKRLFKFSSLKYLYFLSSSLFNPNTRISTIFSVVTPLWALFKTSWGVFKTALALLIASLRTILVSVFSFSTSSTIVSTSSYLHTKKGFVRKYSLIFTLWITLNFTFIFPLGNFTFIEIFAKTPYSSISSGVGFSIKGFFWTTIKICPS